MIQITWRHGRRLLIGPACRKRSELDTDYVHPLTCYRRNAKRQGRRRIIVHDQVEWNPVRGRGEAMRGDVLGPHAAVDKIGLVTEGDDRSVVPAGNPLPCPGTPFRQRPTEYGHRRPPKQPYVMVQGLAPLPGGRVNENFAVARRSLQLREVEHGSLLRQVRDARKRKKSAARGSASSDSSTST